MSSLNKATYIYLFPPNVQEAIEKDVRQKLLNNGLSNEQQEIALQDAMSSRLCDLSDMIDIDKYLES
ncbi:hypothetical protein [Paenibacillus sp. Leaf72]|uniref:hypothetical protein n=1 Tax=Paenibacillus sp. Leaf72 TaxID=1736234 RepID=UPI00070152A4|nr:hypothetical protein [Paenibacillus sp. Leaf72]KQN96846.1 hypothetical protein ASF12_22515 [Paenibacillus sp. Leaf72]